MLIGGESVSVYLACGETDMRKSINGLSLTVKESFKLNPFKKALFVFCNKQRNRIKILTWEENGFWLYLKRLEKGHFKWPMADGDPTMSLSFEELVHIIRSPGIEQKIKRKELKKDIAL